MEKNFNINLKLHFQKHDFVNNAFFIEGGGTRGIYAVGIIKYLFDKNPYINLRDINIFGGTSVGSFLATALSLGCTNDDLIALTKIIDMNALIDSKYLFPITCYRFIRNGYLYDDTGRQNIVKQILNFKIADISKHLGVTITGTDLTFADLKTLIKTHPEIYKHLLINALDISTCDQLFMTTLDDKSDKIKLYTALLASSAIPLVFQPIVLYRDSDKHYNYVPTASTTKNYLVDGGMSSDNPLDYFLMNKEKFNDYNLWLLKFTRMPAYTNIDGIIQMIKQLITYFISGKNNLNTDLVRDTYEINTINLDLDTNVLEMYTPEQIQEAIKHIYQLCAEGKLSFE